MTTVADTGRNKAEASRSFSSLKKIDARISVKRFQAAGLRIVHTLFHGFRRRTPRRLRLCRTVSSSQP
jgi:hypothetical protein